MCASPVTSEPRQESAPVEFRPLSADATEDDGTPMKMQSLCMACHENVSGLVHFCCACSTLCLAEAQRLQGETTMLLAKIPHFREIVVMSFECQHCGERYACGMPACNNMPCSACMHVEVSLAACQRHKAFRTLQCMACLIAYSIILQA